MNFDIGGFETECSPFGRLFLDIAFFVKGFFVSAQSFFCVVKIAEIVFGLCSQDLAHVRSFFALESRLEDEKRHITKFGRSRALSLIRSTNSTGFQVEKTDYNRNLRRLFRCVVYHVCIVQVALSLVTKFVGVFPATLKICEFFGLNAEFLRSICLRFFKIVLGKDICYNLTLTHCS